MTGGGASAPWVICCRCIRPQCLSMPALPPKGNFDWQLSSRGQSQGCPSVVQSCPLLPCGHRSNGERNPIVDLCLTDLSRQILGVFMRHRIPATATLQRNYFFEVRDSDFQRGINRAVANNWVPSICETATAINSRRRDTLSSGG